MGKGNDEPLSQIAPTVLIPELKADPLVVFPNAYGGNEAGAGLDDDLNTPRWQTGPAVQAGRVHVLTVDTAVEGDWTTPSLIAQFLAAVEDTHAPTTNRGGATVARASQAEHRR